MSYLQGNAAENRMLEDAESLDDRCSGSRESEKGKVFSCVDWSWSTRGGRYR
jgi:hypothetical protein